jgi:hypothetical protein
MNKINTPTSSSSDFKTLFSQLESFLDDYLVKKAPALPTNIKDMLVKYAPYISILVVVLSLPPVLALLGIGAILSPLAYMGGVYVGSSFSFSLLFLIASLIVEAVAIPGLFARKQSAWRLMYYGVLINAVYELLKLNLGSLIVGSAISLYFLFQVKSYYK